MIGDIALIAGAVLYVLGAFILVMPGIVYFERYHKPGRLLRALEKLEAESIEEEHVGFFDLKEEINQILPEAEKLGDDIFKMDVYAGTLTTGKGAIFKIRVYPEVGETYQIDEPVFIRFRYQLDRAIRRGKTKMRTVGIALIVLGFTLQMVPELILMF